MSAYNVLAECHLAAAAAAAAAVLVGDGGGIVGTGAKARGKEGY